MARYMAEALKMDPDTFGKLMQKKDWGEIEKAIKDAEKQAKEQKKLNEVAKDTQTIFQKI